MSSSEIASLVVIGVPVFLFIGLCLVEMLGILEFYDPVDDYPF